MNKPLLIGNVTSLAAFEPAIKLQPLIADLGNRYFGDYILTQDLADMFKKILSSTLGEGWGGTASALPAERRRSHLITAQYGAGKSYFLMILSALLDAAGDRTRLRIAKEKFNLFPEMQGLLDQLADKRFLIIQISAEDKGDIRFKELLVHNLLEQVSRVVPEAVFSSEYTEAINHLEDMELSPFGSTFAQVLQANFATSLQQLRARLGSYDREGLRVYYAALEQAVKRPVSRDVLNVETTFQEALDLLKPKGYTHIAILIDEMTAYLKASAGHHSLAETLGELQAFAAHCNKPTSRCLFVGAMHEAMRDFLQERSMQRDYEKTKGRFDNHEFPVYSSELLAGVFQPDEDVFEQAMKGYRGQVKELTDLIERLRMVDDGQAMKLSAFFPLHPAVAHYLPFISRELGQAERTSFGFINDEVRPRLEEPLAKGDRLNLVTLDQVFDYFLPAMDQKEYYRQLVTAYNVVQSKTSNPLAIRAFKPLALLWVASRVPRTAGETRPSQFDLSGQQVTSYINAEDDIATAEALESLTKTGYVYFDASTKRYFYSHAEPGWDLESEIQAEMAKADANEVLRSELQELGSRVHLYVPGGVTVKVERSVESQRVDIRQLEEISAIKPKIADGKVVFVVPDFADMERYSAVFSDVTQKARDLSAPNVAVAVPRKVDMLNHAEFRRYRALQEIGKGLGIGGPGSASEHRVRVTRARLSEVQKRVRDAIETFGQAANFVFFINHQPWEAKDLNTILEDMFQRYYFKFPKVKAERITGRGTTNALIESCIVNPRTTFPSDTSEVARQARDTLQVLGLCTWQKTAGGYAVELKEPEPGTEGYEIWKVVLDTLTGDSSTPLATLYSRLAEAPYGLPDYMVELYLAAAASKTLKKVYIRDKSGAMPNVGKELVTDITKNKDKGYQIVPVQKTTVPYMYICSVWKAIDEPLNLRYYQELEKSLARTVDDPRVWFALKQDSSNLLQNRLSQARHNLGAIEAESAPFNALIKHMEQVKPIVIPAQGFDRLAALGEELSGVKVTDDPDTAAQAVHQVIEASERLLKDWATLQPAYQQYRQLRQVANLGTFGALSQSVDEAWQVYRTDALSAEKRQTFIGQFEKLWAQFARQYVDEHNAVARARLNYGQGAEKSLAYELVGEFSEFGFGGVATRAAFDARIREVRQQACRPLAEDTVRQYQQFGKAACSTCGYRLGTDLGILEQLQESESRLAASISNALNGFLDRLAETLASERTQVYVREKAIAEEKAAIASVRESVGKGRPLNEEQARRLRTLLPPIRHALQQAEEYVREQAKKRRELEDRLAEEDRQRRIPRLPTTQLADTIRSSLLDSGLETMTLKELEAWLARWLQGIVKEFKTQG